ncbi:hypothetical protein A3K69_00325 [Candidatus Bathyarchaeota archaeon RBG_16_57_9]|nr:MAG: hypothetical protein A3K69_00325 [Candidatus Bathyarchaeota archaeon RBG_16_57_9]OGD55005.1 MAG: hypothetical protein A3K81_00155 [Candidatus Bathyarchaeota archaeon RBG_13_60_20]
MPWEPLQTLKPARIAQRWRDAHTLRDPWVENRRHVRNYPHGESIHISRSTLKQLPRVCVSCGETDESRLIVDHVNGDSTDNSPGNLRVLCRRCHLEKTPDSPYTGFLRFDAERS